MQFLCLLLPCHVSQASLKQVISQAEASGELWTRNWDTAPLPHIGAAVALDIERAVDAARAMAAENAQFSSQVVSPSGKRKWGNPPSPHGGSSEDDDDPLAAQKRARRAQRFGDGHADGAVDVPSQVRKVEFAVAFCGHLNTQLSYVM